MSIIGIDPGTTGAAVIICPKRSITYCRFAKEESNRDIWEWLEGVSAGYATALLELVHAIPRDKKHLSNFAKFMQEVGGIKWALDIASIPYDQIDPQVWQREFGLGGLAKADRKKRAVQIAQQLFPSIKVTTDLGDAILIAEYAWRKQYGELIHGRDKNKTPRKAKGILWKDDEEYTKGYVV